MEIVACTNRDHDALHCFHLGLGEMVYTRSWRSLILLRGQYERTPEIKQFASELLAIYMRGTELCDGQSI